MTLRPRKRKHLLTPSAVLPPPAHADHWQESLCWRNWSLALTPGLHDLITLLWASSEAPQQHKGSTSPERCSLLAADTVHCGPTAQGVALESVSSPLTAGSPEFRPRPPPWPLPPRQSLSLLLPRPSPGSSPDSPARLPFSSPLPLMCRHTRLGPRSSAQTPL